MRKLIIVSGFLALSLIVLPQASFAQEVSEEIRAEVEQELTTSAEAVADGEVDIKAEFGLPADFDPVVPNNFFNSVRYSFKKFGRNVQKAAYSAFASDQKAAALLKRQSDKTLAEAVKLQSLDPGNEKVVGILDDYQSRLGAVRDKIEKIKDKDGDFAKELAARVAEDNLFVAPRVLSSIQENLFAHHPEVIPDFIRTKGEALAVASEAVLKASDDSAEAAEAFKTAAFKHFKTPFSGIAAAEALVLAKEHLPDGYEALDEAIKASLDNVENNLQTLSGSDTRKAETFQRYVEQLPGSGLSRMKVVEQFRSRADLPPEMIEKMTEMKAKIAEHISKRIETGPSEAVRQAITEAMFQFKEGKVEDLKLMNEIKDIVPSEEIRRHVQQKHEESVDKFLNRFGDDQNAQALTEEFQALNRRVESGEVVPDANFFKTMEDLKTRLSPQQQKFVAEMEEVGKREMAERMKQDGNFAQRLGSFNPADIEYLEKLKGELQGEVSNFEAKFREIERQQAANFRKLLDVQDDPDKVRKFEQHFEREIPQDLKQRFESRYEFKFEDQYRKFEERAEERNAFFQEKIGEGFPGQQQFPGRGIEEPRREGDLPAGGSDEASKRRPEEDGNLPVPKREEFNPQRQCIQEGGSWNGRFCQKRSEDRVFDRPSDSLQKPEMSQPPTGSFQPPTFDFKPPVESTAPSLEPPSASGEVRGISIQYQFDLLKSLFFVLGLN